MEKFDIVALGFCSNDYLALLPEIPIDSKVQILEHLVQGGGPAATAAVAAARLGKKTAFISIVGDDDPGKTIIRDLEEENVYTGGMQIRQNCNSAIAYCWVDKTNGNRSVAWSRGNLAELEASEVNMDMVRNAKILHLDGHNPKAALAAAQEARKCGVRVSIDAGTLRDGVKEILEYVDILIASEMFARQYSGTDDLEKAIYKLAENGAGTVGVTMGKLGSMTLQDGKLCKCKAFPIVPVDTTGAGDVYHGAYCVKYLETQDPMECMRFAAAVSALKCLKTGGRTGIPTREQVEEFLKNN